MTDTARKRTPRPAKKTAAKKAATPKPPAAREHLTIVDIRHPLPVRRRPTGTYTPQQLAEARAAQASAYARLPIPVINWQTLPDGRSGAYMADDTLIVHTAHRAPEFTAYVLCPHGTRHQHHVTDQATLYAARAATQACTRQHAADDAQHQAITDGVTTPLPAPVVRAPKGITPVKVLADRLTKSDSSNDTTQPTDVSQLRAAAGDTAKEHPDRA